MDRLLFVSPIFPLPLDRGHNLRVLNILEAASLASAVTFVGPPASSVEDQARVAELCEAVVATAPPAASRPGLRTRLTRVIATRSYMGSGTVQLLEPYRAAVAGLDLDSFDLIWVGQPALALLFGGHEARVVVDLDDVNHLKLLQNLRSGRPTPAMAREAIRFLRLAWIELVGSRRYCACLVCSDYEARYLRRWRIRSVVTVPNAIPLPDHPAAAATPRTGSALVFVGNMAYPPNIDAVRFFARSVLPLVRRQLPQATFDVIGPGAGGLAEELAPEVRFRGFVDDLDGALMSYDVFVAPLRHGGGTKLKVLSALASRIPLVTTPIGAASIGIVPGEHALIAKGPAELAAGIVELHRDPTAAARMADAGFDLVRSRFAWEAVRAATTELFVGLTDETTISLPRGPLHPGDVSEGHGEPGNPSG